MVASAIIIRKPEDERARKRENGHLYVSLCLFLIASLISASGSFARESIIDYVIAVVNDQAITLRRLSTEFIIREVENPSTEIKQKVLEELIKRKLMLQEAERMGIPLGVGRRVEKEIQKIKSKYASEALFFEDLQESGLEYSELEEWLRNDFIVKELIARRFLSKIDEPQIDQEAVQYFEQHRSEFVEPMQIQFQYIMVVSAPEDARDEQARAKQLAEALYSRLRTGATFEDIQQAYKDIPSLRVVQEPQTLTPNTKVGLTIAELGINEVSQPFWTPDGYLIARLTGKKLPQQKSYPEVRQQITDRLIQEKLETQIHAWLREQWEAGDIRILVPELAK
ncbi:MAG: peptidyl-prolyl cis-trans isomerase [Candidatus Poribacteria bacterium]|nr:peptidyl-prolyl cis-trans isomerase [Candidatus Poribacteria bacterium]